MEGLRDRYGCIVPELPFGAHTTPMPDDADLSLAALATMIAEFPTKYLRNVPKAEQLLAWADQQRTFAGPILVVWARVDKLMPPTRAERLADHFQNTQLV